MGELLFANSQMKGKAQLLSERLKTETERWSNRLNEKRRIELSELTSTLTTALLASLEDVCKRRTWEGTTQELLDIITALNRLIEVLITLKSSVQCSSEAIRWLNERSAQFQSVLYHLLPVLVQTNKIEMKRIRENFKGCLTDIEGRLTTLRDDMRKKPEIIDDLLERLPRMRQSLDRISETPKEEAQSSAEKDKCRLIVGDESNILEISLEESFNSKRSLLNQAMVESQSDFLAQSAVNILETEKTVALGQSDDMSLFETLRNESVPLAQKERLLFEYMQQVKGSPPPRRDVNPEEVFAVPTEKNADKIDEPLEKSQKFNQVCILNDLDDTLEDIANLLGDDIPKGKSREARSLSPFREERVGVKDFATPSVGNKVLASAGKGDNSQERTTAKKVGQKQLLGIATTVTKQRQNVVRTESTRREITGRRNSDAVTPLKSEGSTRSNVDGILQVMRNFKNVLRDDEPKRHAENRSLVEHLPNVRAINLSNQNYSMIILSQKGEQRERFWPYQMSFRGRRYKQGKV
eukprot:TRINITY_DN9582_c0_g3_i1.p1 TRINITY_DN9582_c0_g3~~TRINITY_DN9582_c0_g3_i1.p1  ORF type:complete len:524 (-),score=95.57 TRINITY_DN9582_c0_g3_i1:57-1628(-)